MFCVILFGLWVRALFSLLPFRYQYQWLPGKIPPEMTYYVSSGTLNFTKPNHHCLLMKKNFNSLKHF